MDKGKKNPHILLSILQFSLPPPTPPRLAQVVLSFAFRYIFFCIIVKDVLLVQGSSLEVGSNSQLKLLSVMK